MKNTLRLTVIGVLVAMGFAQSRAQSTNDTNVITFTTNMEQIVNIALTGFTGGASNATGVANVKIASKDVIQSLASALGIPFSPKAKLIEITAVPADPGIPPAFIVRDVLSRTNVDTDVSAFFGSSTIGTPVVKAKSGKKKSGGNEWSINTFTFGSTGSDTNGPSATTIFFDVQGFTTQTLSSGAFNSTVNGPGSINLLDSVLQGKISGAAGKLKALQIQ